MSAGSEKYDTSVSLIASFKDHIRAKKLEMKALARNTLEYKEANTQLLMLEKRTASFTKSLGSSISRTNTTSQKIDALISLLLSNYSLTSLSDNKKWLTKIQKTGFGLPNFLAQDKLSDENLGALAGFLYTLNPDSAGAARLGEATTDPTVLQSQLIEELKATLPELFVAPDIINFQLLAEKKMYLRTMKAAPFKAFIENSEAQRRYLAPFYQFNRGGWGGDKVGEIPDETIPPSTERYQEAERLYPIREFASKAGFFDTVERLLTTDQRAILNYNLSVSQDPFSKLQQFLIDILHINTSPEKAEALNQINKLLKSLSLQQEALDRCNQQLEKIHRDLPEQDPESSKKDEKTESSLDKKTAQKKRDHDVLSAKRDSLLDAISGSKRSIDESILRFLERADFTLDDLTNMAAFVAFTCDSVAQLEMLLVNYDTELVGRMPEILNHLKENLSSTPSAPAMEGGGGFGAASAEEGPAGAGGPGGIPVPSAPPKAVAGELDMPKCSNTWDEPPREARTAFSAMSKVNLPASPESGLTELHLAALHGDLERITELLQNKNADPNQIQVGTGSTALHFAALKYFNSSDTSPEKSLFKQIYDLLLENGGNPNLPTIEGKTPIELLKTGQAPETDSRPGAT